MPGCIADQSRDREVGASCRLPSVSGKFVGSTHLASGRFAMIDDGIGFQLVPWQPVLDKHIGQHVTGIVRSEGGIEWGFGRKQGLGI